MADGRMVDMSLDGLSPEYLARRAELDVCQVCERPMRPPRSKVEDWPATVAYGTSTQCPTCYHRTYRKGQSAAATPGVEGKKVRHRGEERIVPILVQPRAQVAEGWSAEERSAALMVCEVAESVEVAGEVLEMLGLFQVDRRDAIDGSIGNFRSPRS